MMEKRRKKGDYKKKKLVALFVQKIAGLKLRRERGPRTSTLIKVTMVGYDPNTILPRQWRKEHLIGRFPGIFARLPLFWSLLSPRPRFLNAATGQRSAFFHGQDSTHK